MSKVLSIAVMVLCVSGGLSSLAYLWVNAVSRTGDSDGRNQNILKIIRASMLWSMVFALLTCLFVSDGGYYRAITQASELYRIIAVTWLSVVLACGISLLVIYVFKKDVRSEFPGAVKKLFTTALVGAIIAIALTWLLG